MYNKKSASLAGFSCPTKHILDIKNTFYDMRPRMDVKRGIMQTRVLEHERILFRTASFNPGAEGTALEQR